MIEIKVPTVGESISEVTLLKWLKQNGEYVERDEAIAELESEKATFEVNAEQAGTLNTVAAEGDTLQIGDLLAKIEASQNPSKGGTLESAAAKNDKEIIEPKKETQQVSSTPPLEGKEEAKAAGKGIVEVKVPTIGESISEVTLINWLRKNGDMVQRDEPIAELESEKATFELNAEESGQLITVAKENDVLQIGDLVAKIDSDVAVSQPEAEKTVSQKVSKTEVGAEKAEAVAQPQQPAAAVSAAKATPVASAIIADKKVDTSNITPTGFNGKILKSDVLEALAHPGKQAFKGKELFTRDDRREKMSSLRKTISRRLVEAKNTTAMLTTFNEVDMTRVMEVRKQFKDKFKEVHGVNLGFMSFFAKACAIALNEWPAVNASIDGDAVLYHDYADISIAVSTPRGLTVPIIRNVESLSMADIEKKVIELAGKARDNKLTMEELQGGTFTITNGGVFGSLMSTPIINLPQSAILGMHKIQERPMAINGQVVIRPMMYIALSYDHRIIDGRESVSFLVRVKELLESPEQLLAGKDPVKLLLEL